MKNETLEEVAENYVDSFEYGIAHPRRVCKNAFINGAKWQQERSYSEEEVYNICKELCSYFIRGDIFDVNEWFKQFNVLKNGRL